MNRILPFTTASSGASNTGCVLALRHSRHGAPEGGDFTLSPRVMRWSEDVTLIDLTPTQSYWQQQACERGVSFVEMLMHTMAHDPLQSSDHQTSVLATNPWQAVLALKTFAHRNTGTFLDLSSGLGKNIHRDLAWDDWWASCEEFSHHLHVIDRKTSAPTSLRRNMRAMQQTIERLQATKPAALKELDTPSIQRRFGITLARLWDWAWQRSELRPEEFPWVFLKPQVTPEVSRHIDHPVREWDHIESFLREDLDRLCHLACWHASERVVSLEWVLSLANSPAITVPVLFRHPHHIHRETGHHKTTLLQAFYAWSSTMSSKLRQSQFKQDALFIDHDSITGWHLRVSERLIIPPQMRSLFLDDLSSPTTRLRDLENSLPTALERYDITTDWTPEGSWETHRGDDDENSSIDRPGLFAQFERRPLFIFENPEPLTIKHRSSGWFFCERVMRKWWESEETTAHTRDYYMRIENNHHLQWVFRDQKGDFYVHGIYG